MKINRDYPYMYARVSAKRAKLFDEADYQNLIKMGPNEITRKLEEGEYKREINQLGSNYKGVKLAELALSKNLANEMSDLVEMSDGDLEKVISTYLRKYDILTLKRILRAKYTGQNEYEDYLTPISLSNGKNSKNMKEMTYEEVKNSINFKDSLIDYSERISGKETLADIETAMDQAYYDEITKLAEKTRNEQLKTFIKEEVTYENLKMALRLKKYDLDPEEIERRLLKAKNGKIVDKVIQSDYEDALKHVVKELELGIEPELERVEHAIEVHRLENALRMLHTQPLSLSSILGYVVAKITEVKNLRMLIRAKETGIQNQETIKSNLILSK